MAELTAAETGTWREGERLLLGPAMMRLTLEIVARALFGTGAAADAERIAHRTQPGGHLGLDQLLQRVLHDRRQHILQPLHPATSGKHVLNG